MQEDRRTAIAFVAIVFLAGLNAVAVRVVDRELAPLWGAALRFGLAAAVLLAFGAWRRAALPRGRMFLGSALYGTFGFGAAFGLIHWGLVQTPAGIAQVILATVPALTFVLAVAAGLERFHWRGLAGALVAFAGIAIVFSGAIALSVSPASALAILGAAASMAAANVVVKRFPKPDPVVHNAIGMAVGTLCSLPVRRFWASDGRFPPHHPRFSRWLSSLCSDRSSCSRSSCTSLRGGRSPRRAM